MDFANILATEFNLRLDYSNNIINLINEGNTIPFIARYRKEQHGTCDDQTLRLFADRLTYLTNLEKRKEEVKTSITEQGKWTEDLAKALEKAQKLTEVEDIYRPYKQKRKTRASVAIEKGLQPLADLVLSQKDISLKEEASKFVNAEKGVKTLEEVLSGTNDIIAETISDDATLRKELREFIAKEGVINTKLNAKDEAKAKTYEMYKEHSESVFNIPSHRILAINRAEKEKCLKVNVTIDNEQALEKITNRFIKANNKSAKLVNMAIKDSYKRLIFPSIEREVRAELLDKAFEQAIKMFKVNLKPLLMQPPLKGKVVLALDPAYRTGCKVAVLDAFSNVLDTGVVYPTPPHNKIQEATRIINNLIARFNVDVISIGNGTATKETEIFVANLIKDCPKKELSYIVVNEAGASVYSASKLGAEEFPDYDVALRSAVSIGRRLQDPLAELIKIDVKSIGVGQYQHDMPQKRLSEVLSGVVEDCVNAVGVDLNTASYSLLSYISGLNKSIAKNIVEYRKSKKFTTRKELLKVSKLGEKAFKQCAGFLRIPSAKNILDNTGVHPESYSAVEKLLSHYGYTAQSILDGKIGEIEDKVKKDSYSKVASIMGIGEPTLKDIISELKKPGRDIRESLPKPVLRQDLLSIDDIKEGMEIDGTVRNVIDFGAFVDIGVHQDGLVHLSEICDEFITHPSEKLTVGDHVKVKVLSVDPKSGRIALTMKIFGADKKPQKTKKDYKKNNNKKQNNKKQSYNSNDMNSMLKALQNKFN